MRGGATNNVIGGIAAGNANTIAFNQASGVQIDGSTTTGNAVRGNSSHDNGLVFLIPEIDLTGGALSSTESGPTLSSGSYNSQAGTSTITGSLIGPANTSFDLDFFASPGNTQLPEGTTYLGTATIVTDPTGQAVFTITLPTGTTTGDVFTATATSAGGNTTPFSNAVSGAGLPPTVTLSGPLSATIDIPMPEFTANVSSATQAAPYSFNWSVTESGNSAFALPADVVTTGQSFSFTPTQPGSYTVTATVTDALANSGFASQVVNVGAIGPGIVITNNPVVSTVKKPVTVTSAPANDAGTPPTSYNWTVTDNGQPFSVANASGSSLSFTPTAPGLYAITVTATFAPGVSNTTTSYLVVTGGVPTTQIVGAPTSALEGTPITLAASADPSLAGTLSYAWTVTKNGVPFASQTSTQGDTFSFTPTTAGKYQTSLTISDSAGDKSTANAVTITVTAVPPTASITLPTSFTSGTVGTAITLTGNATTTGTNDAITSLQWSVYSSGAGKAIATGSGSSFTYTPSAAGMDMVTFTATNSGGASNSASVAIPIAAAPLTLTPSGTFQATTPAQVTLSVPNPVSGLSYTFTWTVAGATVPFNLTGSGSTVAFTPPLPGSYQVTATAKGSDGSVYSSSQIYSAALAPLAASIFGAPASAFAGQPITLADPVFDPSRKGPLSYTWSVSKNGSAFTSQTTSQKHVHLHAGHGGKLPGRPDRHRYRDQ